MSWKHLRFEATPANDYAAIAVYLGQEAEDPAALEANAVAKIQDREAIEWSIRQVMYWESRPLITTSRSIGTMRSTPEAICRYVEYVEKEGGRAIR